MTARIISIGTALPPHSIDQRSAGELAAQLAGAFGERGRALTALHRRSRIDRRASALLEPAGEGVAQRFYAPATSALDGGPTTAERMARYTLLAGALGAQAAARAIEGARIGAGEFTHVVTASCTGFDAPGFDQTVMRLVGVPPTAERTHIGFMGCHAGLNALRVARAFVEADAGAVVLVCCVELCSLHLHYGDDAERMVANAIFADGAAAAVVRAADEGAYTIDATGACIIPETADAMRWRLGNNGFEMGLSTSVPALISDHLAEWLVGWLAQRGLTIEKIGAWAVHPGGPRVLEAVSEALSLPAGALDASRETLREHGNMSSPTVFFILDRLARAGSAPGPCVALAFGPGLCVEAALLSAQ